MTKIIACKCEHEGQDKMYGNGRRVHNEATGKSRADKKVWRCTVCRLEK